MEFNVIKTGGKQYVVSKGTIIDIEKLPENMKSGDKISFDEVLLVDNGKETKIGTPMVSKASVKGEILFAGKGKKVEIMKYKAKSRYLKQRGHRQERLRVKITDIA